MQPRRINMGGNLLATAASDRAPEQGVLPRWGTSGQPGLPDAPGIARQALGNLDVIAVAAGLMRAIGCTAGWSWRVTLGLSSVGPPRVLMMIQLLANAATGGSPSITVLPPETSVWRRHDRAASSETTKWVSTLLSEGAGNSAL
jgi:hypothetical protein